MLSNLLAGLKFCFTKNYEAWSLISNQCHMCHQTLSIYQLLTYRPTTNPQGNLTQKVANTPRIAPTRENSYEIHKLCTPHQSNLWPLVYINIFLHFHLVNGIHPTFMTIKKGSIKHKAPRRVAICYASITKSTPSVKWWNPINGYWQVWKFKNNDKFIAVKTMSIEEGNQKSSIDLGNQGSGCLSFEWVPG